MAQTPAADDLAEMAVTAFHKVVDATVPVDVTYVVGASSIAETAIFFDFVFEQEKDRARAALLRARLTQELRDRLIERDDPRYPYVAVASPSSRVGKST